jgi:hypothetical protein
MKKKLLFLVLILLTACSSIEEKREKEAEKAIGSEVSYENLKTYPAWVVRPSYDNGLAGVGSAKISEAGFDFARKEAMANARTELASQIAVRVNSLFKSYVSKVGEDEFLDIEKSSESISKQIVSEVLIGSHIKDTWISKENEIFMLVVAEYDSIAQATKDAMRQAKGYVSGAEEAEEELDMEIEKALYMEE